MSLHVTEHICLGPETERLSGEHQNRARETLKHRHSIKNEHEKTLKLCQPIKNEHEKNLRHRKPIRIPYYAFRVISQSESNITLPGTSQLGWQSLLGSRLLSARYSLS